MKILANEIRIGHIIEYKNSLWYVTQTPEHIKPGKGGAYVQIEMRNITNKSKTTQRLQSHQAVEKPFIEQKKISYLYTNQDKVTFLDQETLEEIVINKEVLGENVVYLIENIIFEAKICKDKIIAVLPPATINMTIKEADPFIKTARESPSYKGVVVDNDLKVLVPPYLEVGNIITIRTEDKSFVAKVK